MAEQVTDMLQEYETMIKIVVDIRRRVLAGGGEMHSDCETSLLEEAKYLIEWTAAEAEPEVAADLVAIQTQVNLWLRVWDKASQMQGQRTLLSVQAKYWSSRVLDHSGLLKI